VWHPAAARAGKSTIREAMTCVKSHRHGHRRVVPAGALRVPAAFEPGSRKGDCRKISRFVALLLSALTSGVFFGTRAGLGPSTKQFRQATYVEVQQATIRNLRPVMGTLLPASVAANLALLAVTTRGTGRSRAAALTAGGLLGQIASLAVTARYELPINSGVLTWSPTTPPPGWQTARDRWNTFHTVRTATSVAALACLTAAVLGDPPRSQR
jgi:uncharacterized membrane protein